MDRLIVLAGVEAFKSRRGRGSFDAEVLLQPQEMQGLGVPKVPALKRKMLAGLSQEDDSAHSDTKE